MCSKWLKSNGQKSIECWTKSKCHSQLDAKKTCEHLEWNYVHHKKCWIEFCWANITKNDNLEWSSPSKSTEYCHFVDTKFKWGCKKFERGSKEIWCWKYTTNIYTSKEMSTVGESQSEYWVFSFLCNLMIIVWIYFDPVKFYYSYNVYSKKNYIITWKKTTKNMTAKITKVSNSVLLFFRPLPIKRQLK